ncbi:hypothetical protein GCM10020000_28540 [Streptomyces olivoverticillatus]
MQQRGAAEAAGTTAARAPARTRTSPPTTPSAARPTRPVRRPSPRGAKEAKKGGTVTVLQRDAFHHLDPGQIYFGDMLISQLLYNRSLTGYKVDENGKVKVVGDLATDTGTSADGGKTWKFTLKDGLKWQDGSPITSQDVRWGIERLYASFETDGPQYIQQWLSGDGTSYRKALPDGPYDGKHLPSSVLDTPDDKTIVFHFLKPHADAPFATAMPNIGAVKADKDGKQKYDNEPFSSGPYQVADYKTGKSLTLVRNTNWNPKTDPIRHQYPDKFEISFGHQATDSTRRLLADQGPDKYGMSYTNAVAPEMVQKVLNDSRHQEPPLRRDPALPRRHQLQHGPPQGRQGPQGPRLRRAQRPDHPADRRGDGRAAGHQPPLPLHRRLQAHRPVRQEGQAERRPGQGQGPAEGG